MDRRDFLSTGAGAAAALAVVSTSSPVEGAAWTGLAPPAATVNRAQFEQWLNSAFRLRQIGALRSAEARVIAIHDGPRAHRLEQFHVVFSTPTTLASGRYALRHGSGTELELWLDRVIADDEPPRMRATFCLIDGA